MLLSILIPTLTDRKKKFDFICNKIQDQIQAKGLGQEIEILFFEDNRKHSIGHKRNWLIEQAVGKYIMFVDDDDDVSYDFIEKIYEGLLTDPDCISLVGIITFSGNNPKQFIHSIKYNKYFEKDNVYFRPPNHLNPIRRDIAVKFPFKEINFAEDTDYAMRICNAGLLKKEYEISKPYYYYKFDPVK
jgi:cellulose synthase/poly-beta-1,6-N-acetylglucosamine synthase-like glycosyltransferase